MIDIGEVQRIAGALGVAPTVIDHDYVLGCFLHFLGQQPEVRAAWLFKGGTSLQKCHFGTYRFSEDLDFTATEAITAAGLLLVIDRAKQEMQESIGIKTSDTKTKIEIIDDDYGRESFECKLYYRGAWDYGGSLRSLQIHLSRDELVVFDPVIKSVLHSYSDENDLPQISVRAYALEETFAEKLRAFSGQRKHAIARDVFDLYFLISHGVDAERAISAFTEKCKIKGLDPRNIRIDSVEQRKKDFQLNWSRTLEYLLPNQLKVPFEEAWSVSITALRKALNS